MLTGSYSAQEIVREAEKLTNVADQMFLLRNWASNTRDYGAAPNVVRYALEFAIKNAEYTPNALHFRELATPLVKAVPSTEIDTILGILDSQQSVLEQRGPTEEYVALQLLIAEIESRKDKAGSSARLLETYLYMEDIVEPATRCSSLAHLLAALSVCDRERSLEGNGYSVHSETLKSFSASVDILLSEPADQMFVVGRVLDTLARNNIDVALSIAVRLNTVERRDDALERIVLRHLQLAPDQIDWNLLNDCIKTVWDVDQGHSLLQAVVHRIQT